MGRVAFLNLWMGKVYVYFLQDRKKRNISERNSL